MVRNHPSSIQTPTRRGRGRPRSIRLPSANEEFQSTETPNRISYYDNSIRNLSQTFSSPNSTILSPVLESTVEPSNFNSSLERKLNSIKSKVYTILGYLANLFLAKFSKKSKSQDGSQ